MTCFDLPSLIIRAAHSSDLTEEEVKYLVKVANVLEDDKVMSKTKLSKVCSFYQDKIGQ